MEFQSKDFLLSNKTAKTLYYNYAANMPIIDFHCHLNPKEIYENENYENITKIWLNKGTYGDHYKWRLIRTAGFPEELITGNASDYDKFLAFAKTLEQAIGNPVYEWTHLELKRFFHIDEQINRKTAPEIWKKANELLQTDAFKPRNLIKNSNVKAVCTTDDPVSDLHFHKLIAKDEAENGFKTLPALRPDKLIHLENKGFGDYLKELSSQAGVEIHTFADIKKAMYQRFEYFTSMGGSLSDHSLETFYFEEADEVTLNKIIAKAVADETLTAQEIHQYVTMLLEELMKLNHEFDWTMQFHINSIRNINHPMFAKIGADTGYDMMGTQPDIVANMQQLYTHMTDKNVVPKSIFYSLNPNDWMMLATLMQSLQGNGKQHLQLGAGWWFNDTAEGMNTQLEVFANQSLLPNFVGMLTDSRSFLSYPRHEYFRRVLCSFLGNLVDQGRIPDDEAILGKMVQDISYNNAHDYFGFFK